MGLLEIVGYSFLFLTLGLVGTVGMMNKQPWFRNLDPHHKSVQKALEIKDFKQRQEALRKLTNDNRNSRKASKS